YPNAAGTYTEITLNRPTGFKFDYDRIKIYYVADGLYKFEMTGKGDNNSEKKIEVVISRTSSLPAGSDGAVGMYGNDPAITCSGSCSIDGHDWDRPPIDCNGASCRPSVAGPGPDVAGLYTSETAADGASASGNITGNALYGSPNWQQGGGANTEETWVNFVNRILSGTYNDASDNVFGTRAAPTIVVASEDLHIASNGNHAGILIINNVDFQFTGTPVWEGLIILVGDNAKFGAGNANLYGSLITINHPEGTTAVTTGNGGLNYSSAALKNLEKIPGMTGAKIVSWRDLSID
ncbi:MAG: hypothetical protein JW943_14360, partial [Deltaproteobacteria bacterium]|nr:hypothetical protein [Deltaproteobacteria bacterium]